MRNARSFASISAAAVRGLAIAIGELVDDAIVDVENVLRRLRERAVAPEPRPSVLETVFVASKEIRSAIVSATWILLLVFLLEFLLLLPFFFVLFPKERTFIHPLEE